MASRTENGWADRGAQPGIFCIGDTFWTSVDTERSEDPRKAELVNSLGDKNVVVVRLNTISEQVMNEEEIEIIDIYSVLAKRLELASGDGYHWQGAAYETISQEIAKRVLPALGKK